MALLAGLQPALAADPVFESSWGYSYCYPEGSGCTHATGADVDAGSLHLAVDVASPNDGADPGQTGGGGAQDLIGHGMLDRPAGSVLLTAVVRLDRAEAAATGSANVRSKLRIGGSVDECAGSGCMGGGDAPLVGTGDGMSASRTGENVTVQFRFRNQAGGNLPAGPLTYTVGIDGNAAVGDMGAAAGTAGLDLAATVLSVSIEPGPLLVQTEVEATAAYLGGGLYNGPSTPTPCSDGGPQPSVGYACFPVPDGATHVRVLVDDAVSQQVGGTLRGNLAPGHTDTPFCGSSAPMQVHPGSGWVVAFVNGPRDVRCGTATTGTVTAVFTVWQEA